MPKPPSTSSAKTSARDHILDCADALIGEAGIERLTTRTIATRAGCAIGAIPYHFGGIAGLVMAINERTLARMGAMMFVRARAGGPSALDRLEALAFAYLDFAHAQRHHWDALFSLKPSDQQSLPQTYLDTRASLITGITTLFDAATPLPPEGAGALARTLYEAVHGIVWLGLTSTLGGDDAAIRMRLSLLLRLMIGPRADAA